MLALLFFYALKMDALAFLRLIMYNLFQYHLILNNKLQQNETSVVVFLYPLPQNETYVVRTSPKRPTCWA